MSNFNFQVLGNSSHDSSHGMATFIVLKERELSIFDSERLDVGQPGCHF